jgi:hypothetical protein
MTRLLRTLLVTALCAISTATMLSGGPKPVKLHDGTIAPSDVVVLEHFVFMACDAVIDGKEVPKGSYSDIELAPGRHVIQLEPEPSRYVSSNQQSSSCSATVSLNAPRQPATLTVEAAPGSRFRLRQEDHFGCGARWKKRWASAHSVIWLEEKRSGKWQLASEKITHHWGSE